MSSLVILLWSASLPEKWWLTGLHRILNGRYDFQIIPHCERVAFLSTNPHRTALWLYILQHTFDVLIRTRKYFDELASLQIALLHT